MLSICIAYDKDIFEKFKKDNQGLYYNIRLEQEIIKRKKYTQSRRKNASGKRKAYVKHMEDENEDVIINIDFNIFWDLYDKKVGSKDKCIKKWDKFKDEERQTIINTLPLFLKSIKEKKYQPYPETYLNQKRWNDEIKEDNPYELPKITAL